MTRCIFGVQVDGPLTKGLLTRGWGEGLISGELIITRCIFGVQSMGL